MDFATAIKILQLAAAAASAAAQARQIATIVQTSLKQSAQLTPEQSAELDALAQRIFEAPESQPSGR